MDGFPDDIAGYRLQKKLSAGGMGAVYLATKSSDHGFEKQVAIKVMLPHLFEKEESRQLFIDEARLAAQLNHPNICQVFDFGNHGGVYYLVMEYVDGVRVLDIIQALEAKGTRLPTELAARIIADAARGLHFAHNLKSRDGAHLGVVHRDISPENIIVTRDGFTKVLDFGIARWENRAAETQQNIIRGKAPYMSPEHASGKTLDARSDVFALGVLLHELLTLRPLFHRGDFIATLESVRNEDAPALHRYRDDVSDRLQQVVNEALRKNPAKRIASADRLSTSLEEFIRESGKPATSDALSAFIADEILRTIDRKAQSAASVPNAFTRTLISSGPSSGAGQTEQISDESSASSDFHDDTGVWQSGSEDEPVVSAPASRLHTEVMSDDLTPMQAMSGHNFVSRPTDVVVTEMSQQTPTLPTQTSAALPVAPEKTKKPALVAGSLLLIVVSSALVWWSTTPADEAPAAAISVPTTEQIASQPVAPDRVEAVVEAARDSLRKPEPAQRVLKTEPEKDPAPIAASASAAKDAVQPKAPKKKRKKRRRKAPEKAEAVRVSGTGKLSVQAVPWGIVYLDDKRQGTTPILGKEVSVGTYRLQVRSPETEQVVYEEFIRIQKGVHRKVKVKKR